MKINNCTLQFCNLNYLLTILFNSTTYICIYTESDWKQNGSRRFDNLATHFIIFNRHT